MNRVAIVVLFATIASIVACDPGMTIRQIRAESSTGVQLVIEVSPANKFIGSRIYGAKTKLTNQSNSSIAIQRCDLVSPNATYESRLGGGESYPFVLAPRASKYFGPFFQLKDPVHDVFKHPAELRVHYVIDGREVIARASLSGGSLR